MADFSDTDSERDLESAYGFLGYQFEPLRQDSNELDETLFAHRENDSDPEEEPEERGDAMGWCQCHRCDIATLTRAKERRCCLETESMRKKTVELGLPCITAHESFPVLCLNQDVLRNVLVSLNNIRCDNWPINPLENRSLRWAAYRQFTWWIHGYLGKRVRRVIPACVVDAIRKRFPAPEGIYEPYASDSEDND